MFILSKLRGKASEGAENDGEVIHSFILLQVRVESSGALGKYKFHELEE
ncbi:MAG TPA: hypothetical protein PKL79_10660 [Rectinema sp.]|jgi:hypothetical protein|nr:hypothetical protein [Rectinema sp.]